MANNIALDPITSPQTDGSKLTSPGLLSNTLKANNSPDQHLERDAPSHAREREAVPPNGGFGWVCVVCLHLINGHTWGLNSVSDCSYLSTANHGCRLLSFAMN
jgi:hypothetical protein